MTAMYSMYGQVNVGDASWCSIIIIICVSKNTQVVYEFSSTLRLILTFDILPLSQLIYTTYILHGGRRPTFKTVIYVENRLIDLEIEYELFVVASTRLRLYYNYSDVSILCLIELSQIFSVAIS